MFVWPMSSPKMTRMFGFLPDLSGWVLVGRSCAAIARSRQLDELLGQHPGFSREAEAIASRTFVRAAGGASSARRMGLRRPLAANHPSNAPIAIDAAIDENAGVFMVSSPCGVRKGGFPGHSHATGGPIPDGRPGPQPPEP